MRGLGRKVSVLVMVAVIATAIMGAAYSLWFENLQATATITTGSLDAGLICAPPVDNENVSWPSPPSTLLPFKFYPKAKPLKDVATAPVGSGLSPYEWDISVSNTYPGYMIDCELHMQNTASVPWHVE